MIERVLQETRERAGRALVLPAHVEIMLAVGDMDSARAGAEELRDIAHESGAMMLTAWAARSNGAVLLAADEPGQALEHLRDAYTRWRELEAPYEAARVRVLIALACRALADEDGATMELESARWTFEKLGAEPDIRRVSELAVPARPASAHGLTGREFQVLRLVASGLTNRAIGERLSISERTVERHVSNIFGKLRVASRTEAAAHAYERGLV
jgi:DNA-binding NarL/FixJ family response regulator